MLTASWSISSLCFFVFVIFKGIYFGYFCVPPFYLCLQHSVMKDKSHFMRIFSHFSISFGSIFHLVIQLMIRLTSKMK